MTTRIITADEAKSMLASATPGPWMRDGLYVRNDPHDVALARALDDEGNGCGESFAPHNANLLAAAPDLAATVVAQAAEIERLTRELTAARAALRNENAARVALHRVTSAMPFALSDVLSDDERDALDHCTDEDHAVAMRAAEVSR